MPSILQYDNAIKRAQAAGDVEAAQILSQQLDALMAKEYGYTVRQGSDSGFFEDIASGFGAGAVGMAESAALGTAALLEEEEELKAREKIQSIAKSLRPEGGDPESITYKLSSGIGSIAGMALPAAAAAYAAPAAATTAVGLGVAGALGVGAGAGEASERARKFGATEEERGMATLRGAAIGSLEVLPLGKILRVPGVTGLMEKLGEGGVGLVNRLRKMAVTGTAEGVQEATSAILQNLNARGYDPEAELINAGVLEEGAIGGGSGAIVQGLVDLFVKGKTRTPPGTTEPTDGPAPEVDQPRLEEDQVQGELFPTSEDDVRQVIESDEGRVPYTTMARDEEDAALAELGITREEYLNLSVIERDRVDEAAGLSPTRSSPAQLDLVDQAESAQYAELEAEDTETQDRAARAARGEKQVDMFSTELEDAEIKALYAEDAATAAEVKAEPDLLTQVKEAKTKNIEQQLPLPGMQTKSAAKKQGVKQGDVKYEIDPTAAAYAEMLAPEINVAEIVPENGNIVTVNDVKAKVSGKKQKLSAEQKRLAKEAQEKVEKAAAKKKKGEGAVIPVGVAPTEGVDPNAASTASEIVKRFTGKELPTFTSIPSKESVDSTSMVTAKAQPRPEETVTATEVEPEVEPAVKPAVKPVASNVITGEAVPKEFLDPADDAKIEELKNTSFPTNYVGIDKTAKAYLSKYDTPVEAYEAIAFELAEKTPKYQKQEGSPDKDIAKFSGTGGENTRKTAEWIKQNLSPALKTRIDKRVKEQEATSKKVEAESVKRKADEAAAKKKKEADKKKAEAENATRAMTGVAAAAPKGKGVDTREVSDAELNDLGDTTPVKVDTAKATTESRATLEAKEKQSADLAIQMEEFIKAGGSITSYLKLDKLDSNVAKALNADLSRPVKELLKKGDLRGALQELAKTSTDKRVKQIARALSENTGTTKLEIANTASIASRGYDTRGEAVPGLFDPSINTIILNSNLPLTVHTLLHEMTHAATINVLKNRSHPLTKQMQKLFDDVKPYLDSVYGTESLNEFIAEAFSNPKFQQALAKINPRGEPISGLQRFFRSVINFVRRLIGMDTKPLDSALDAADIAIMGMLSPSTSSRGGGALYMKSTPDGVKEILNDLGNVQKSIDSKVTLNAFMKEVTDFFKDANVTAPARALFARLANTQVLGDLARKAGLGQLGLDLHEAIENQIGDMKIATDAVKAVITAKNKWAKEAGLEAYNMLNHVIYSPEYGATIYQVDPTKPESDYKGKTSPDGVHKLDEIWRKQRKEWDKLKGNGGQAMFTLERDMYAKQYKELLNVINGQIDELVGKDSATSRQLKKDVFQRMFAAGKLDVYFPLVRQGNFKVSFTAKIRNEAGEVTSTEPVFLMYEHKSDRDQAIEDLKSDPDVVDGKVDAYEGETDVSRFKKDAPSGSFVGDVLGILEANSVDNAVQEQVMRLFIDALPESSFAKSLQRRTNTLGFIADSTLALRMKGFNLAAQVVKMKNSAILRSIEKQITDVSTPASAEQDKFAVFKPNAESLKIIKEELLRRAKFARSGADNKEREQGYKLLNQVAFIYTIGFNASSALVNLSQIPLVVVPFLSGQFGAKETMDAMGRASKLVGVPGKSLIPGKSIADLYDVTGEGRARTYTLSKSHEKKIRDNTTSEAEADAKIAELNRLGPLMKEAYQRGMIQNTALGETQGISDAQLGKTKNPALRILDWVTTTSGVMFTAAEMFNRQTTMIMSYDLIIDRMETSKKEGKKYFSNLEGKFIDVPSNSELVMERAAKEAMYITQEVNGGSVLETAPGMAQQGIGRVALMYKGYGLQMYATMLKAGRVYINNLGGKDAESIELRKMARNQLIGVHLSALFFAGVQGLPLYGAVSMLVDLYQDDDEDDADTLVRKYVAEGWYKGAVAELTGIDVASRVRLTGLLLANNKFNRDPSLEENIGIYFGGPALSTANRLKRGVEDLFLSDEYDAETYGMESLMPAGLTNLWRNTVGRYAKEGGIQNRRKNPIYDDMTSGEVFAAALGFPPAEYTFRQEQNSRNKGIEISVAKKRSALTTKYYVASKMGDYDSMNDTLKDINAFNVKYAKDNRAAAITPASIRKSLKGHRDTTARTHNGITISPLMQYAIERSNAEYKR
jgi:hypothetical protein